MEAERKDIKQHKPLPAPNSDFYELAETLPADELKVVKRVREFMETKVAPVITKYWVEDSFPFELLPAVKELGIGGLGIKGYGRGGGNQAGVGVGQKGDGRVEPLVSEFLGVGKAPGWGFDSIDWV